jgi:hypothetical protein
MRARTLFAALVALVLATAGPAAAGNRIFVGAAEDAAKADLVTAKAKMTLARLAGYDAVRLTAIWEPGETAPADELAEGLRNATAAASLNGIRVIVSVYHYGAKTTPLTPAARSQFAAYSAALAEALAPDVADFIVGNEPNLNRFWMPQFRRNGASASPAAYLALLAETYDALKAVSPRINVIGGSVSPRGQDKPNSARQTHSPTRFISELGAAYRASGRRKPVMDTLAFHPYLENSLPPTTQHPRTKWISLNDYPKLVAVLGQAFDGTAQPGSKLPIIYDEFGYEARIPAHRVPLYTGADPPTIKALDEQTMGAYYKQALELTVCQPNVRGMLFFLVSDEPARDTGWQSGVYYADDTPKSFLPAVRDTALAARAGTLGLCPAGGRTAVPADTGLAKRVQPAKLGKKKAKLKKRGKAKAKAAKRRR